MAGNCANLMQMLPLYNMFSQFPKLDNVSFAAQRAQLCVTKRGLTENPGEIVRTKRAGKPDRFPALTSTFLTHQKSATSRSD